MNLTQDIRAHIVTQAIAAAFNDQSDAMRDAEDALCRLAYAECYSATEIRQSAALPVYWLRRDQCLNFTVGGMRVNLNTKDNHLPVPYANKRTLAGGYHCHSSHGDIPSGDLADRIMALAEEKDEHRKARERTERSLHALLQKFRTVKKLAEAWRI